MRKNKFRAGAIAATLLLTALLSALACTLTSCGGTLRLHFLKGEEQAMYLFSTVNENAARATSCTVEQVLYLKLTLNGVDYEQSTTANVTSFGQGEDMTSVTRITREMTVGGTHTVAHNDYGYIDGMIFSCHREGDAVSKIKSLATAAEYESFTAEQNQDEPEIAVGEDYANTMSCRKNSDGTWTATFEDFTDTGMASFWDMLSGVESMVTAEHAISNVRMTCTADKALNLSSISIEYIFEENPEAESPVPVVRMDFRYSDWDKVSESELYDLSDFTEVDDIRYVERFLDALEDRQTAESGSLTVVNEMTASSGENTQRQNAAQIVAFDNSDGYRFTAKTIRATYDTIVTYRDGTLTSEVRDHKTGSLVNRQEESFRDYEAQTAIQQFMNGEDVSGIDLVSASMVSATKDLYRFNLGESVKNKLNSRYQSTYGRPIDTFDGYVEATIKDGKLESYTYVTTVTLTVGNLPMTVTSSTSVTFDTPVEGGEVV